MGTWASRGGTLGYIRFRVLGSGVGDHVGLQKFYGQCMCTDLEFRALFVL